MFSSPTCTFQRRRTLPFLLLSSMTCTPGLSFRSRPLRLFTGTPSTIRVVLDLEAAVFLVDFFLRVEDFLRLLDLLLRFDALRRREDFFFL